MAEPPTLRIRALRLRVSPHVLEGSDTALRDAVRRQLPAHLDPAVAEPLAVELVRSVRRSVRGAATGTGEWS